MIFFQFFITCERTNNAINAALNVKLGKKRRKSSKRNYYIISPRVIVQAIIISNMIVGSDYCVMHFAYALHMRQKNLVLLSLLVH